MKCDRVDEGGMVLVGVSRGGESLLLLGYFSVV